MSLDFNLAAVEPNRLSSDQTGDISVLEAIREFGQGGAYAAARARCRRGLGRHHGGAQRLLRSPERDQCGQACARTSEIRI